MNTKYFISYNCSNWQRVELINQGLPNFGVTSSFAVEITNSCNTGALMATSQ